MPPKSPELLVATASLWRDWLAHNSLTASVIWLVVAKKGFPDPPTSLTYASALDEALCYGWIDSGGGSRDAGTYYFRFTPRKAKSAWSRRNVGYVERLEREGRMQEPGRAMVERARANGMLDAAYSAEPPADLLHAIAEAGSGAQAKWELRPKKERYGLLVKLGSLSVGSEARVKRIQAVVGGLADVGAVGTQSTVKQRSSQRRKENVKLSEASSMNRSKRNEKAATVAPRRSLRNRRPPV